MTDVSLPEEGLSLGSLDLPPGLLVRLADTLLALELELLHARLEALLAGEGPRGG